MLNEHMDSTEEPRECGICLESYTKEAFVPLICTHEFCKECCKKHFASSIKCPLCRQNAFDPEKTVTECVFKAKQLLQQLENVFIKIESCEKEAVFVDEDDPIKKECNELFLRVIERTDSNGLGYQGEYTNASDYQINLNLDPVSISTLINSLFNGNTPASLD